MQLLNSAAYIPSERAQLSVSDAPYPTCGDDELVIRAHAVAINPVDWKIQTYGGSFIPHYPTILGEDVAGKIIQVGSSLTHFFRPGQRVIGHASGLSHGAAYGAFQKYPVLKGSMVCVIPEDISYEDAVVLPLSISTAAVGLFWPETLGLKLGSPAKPYDTKFAGTLLVWGGSSSVGSSVIQLAWASGYAVVATASSSNIEYCKKLGAASVLDYHDPHVVSKLVSLLKGTENVGAYDAIGSEDTVGQCAAVLQALGGGRIASVGVTPTVGSGVEVVGIMASDIENDEPEVARRIWGSFVPSALKSGKLAPYPEALVIGEGLDDVQKGLDVQKKGVSAKKVVITLK
ncbi:zinc-binding oxidoreductase CipB [Podospora didyma]|uniref:Zinc-binding oxidoreductase CipB n=1 Tax=Podospora didyma TaxID=330526 RepID=A0AAE0U6Y2_9PEZI|nr:zinc-binding oxidoreductase CipB [Podospora didyma]